jgi:hypothetical protein
LAQEQASSLSVVEWANLVTLQVPELRHYQQLVVLAAEEVGKDNLQQQEDLLEQMVRQVKEIKVVMVRQVLLVDMEPAAAEAPEL